MKSAKNYISLIELNLLLRDAELFFLGFLNMKKMHELLADKSTDETNQRISEITGSIINYTRKINDLDIEYEKIVHMNNVILRQAEIKFQEPLFNIKQEIDKRTKKSVETYTPAYKSIDIDIIQSIKQDAMDNREKLLNIQYNFMIKNAHTVRLQYLRNKTLLFIDAIEINGIHAEINEIETLNSRTMEKIQRYKQTFSEDLQNNIYTKALKDSIEFIERYVSILMALD